MKLDEGDYLAHYGTLRKSGRYPWGSGANPQKSRTFLDDVNNLRKQGLTESEIAKAFSTPDHPFTTSDLRALKSRATNEVTQDKINTINKLKAKGMSDSAIGRQMGINESSVRSLSAPGRAEKADQLKATADMLRRQVEEKEFIDVGSNVEKALPIGDNPETEIGISHDKFQTALSVLKAEGYQVHTVKIRQVGTGEMTTYKVLAKPGTTQKDVFLNRDKIRLISERTQDGGRTYDDLKPPLNISSKRVGIRYKEDGGADADGVIYVRPGVKDIELGKARYAQVRIGIDGTHYLKGMAVYKDDLPKGVDLQFNTNKSNTGNKLDAMKPQKTDDPVNPFGAAIKIGGQIKDEHGRVTSAMNIINEEGDWDKWSRKISPQVLSKQSPDVAKSQLNWTFERRRAEFEEIKGLTNPKIRQKLLDSFAEETDSAAVHLKAAAMPKQANKVLLPSNHVKPTEIFAPTFKNGDRVVLIRYPHAGTFEIPELTVNNRTPEAKKLLGVGKGGTAPDVVVIHPKVAERLSGADFDGDAVVVIPNHRGTIETTRPLDNLKGFDPQQYKVPLGPKTKKYPEGTPIIEPATKQHEMGNITNLIADMTVKGANTSELSRAVRHSMVVIDSEKHNLDYKRSAIDHGILDLKRRYQGVHPRTGLPRGASTLITRATSEIRVPNRKARPAAQGGGVDRTTGRKEFVDTGEHTVRFKDPTSGKVIVKASRSKAEAEAWARDNVPAGVKVEIKPKTFKSQKLAETEDAHTLVSDHGGTQIEHVYADHSNKLKAMANEARLESLRTPLRRASPSAKVTYSDAVQSLKSQLAIAEKNAPLERQAQVVANTMVAQRKRANPTMDKDTERKISGQALTTARIRTGAGKTRIDITPREWEAIQAGAISNHMLEKILRNTDVDKVRKLATPRVNPVMTPALTSRARTMLASGYTAAEVADHLGVAVSTLKSSVAEGG